MLVPPPQSENELLSRATAIAGCSLSTIANELGISIPPNLQREKGWVGQLLEITLGASGSSQPLPDFVNLGIELKTLPINAFGKPKESTFVCVVELQNVGLRQWENSLVRRKLSRVLWIPIEADEQIPLAERKIGMPLLWSPTGSEERILRTDWEELMDLVVAGQFDQISSRLGKYLQIRPKAANAKALTTAIDGSGELIVTLPRGFYLRSQFTATLLEQYY